MCLCAYLNTFSWSLCSPDDSPVFINGSEFLCLPPGVACVCVFVCVFARVSMCLRMILLCVQIPKPALPIVRSGAQYKVCDAHTTLNYLFGVDWNTVCQCARVCSSQIFPLITKATLKHTSACLAFSAFVYRSSHSLPDVLSVRFSYCPMAICDGMEPSLGFPWQKHVMIW